MYQIGIVSLGCAKNLIDSEMILAMFRGDEYKITSDPSQADLIIINTCGFIAAAKKESIAAILEMRRYKAKLVVVGCLAERYLDELKSSLPEVDLFVPIREYPHLESLIGALLKQEGIAPLDPLKRVISTPSYCAYLRISEGCNNFCSFCAIPFIRGRFVSRPFAEIATEAKQLRAQGVKEISLVSQDTTRYGADFASGHPNIVDLLKELDGLGFYSIRLLYLYPSEISDELLSFIAQSRSVAHYFDVPVQCASDHLLGLMKRHGSQVQTVALFGRIKQIMPEAVLRTTLIAGFPGETDADQAATLRFIEETPFDHLGVFTYSREEGTASYDYPDQLPEKIKKARRAEIMKKQAEI